MSREIRCFWVVDTGRDRAFLRRFVFRAEGGACPGPMGTHDAMVPIEEMSGDEPIVSSRQSPPGFESDPRWPTRCSCGYEFKPEDNWQVFRTSIYKRPDTNEEWDFRSLPAGAMYDAEWLHGDGGKRVGPDGLALHVVCPPGASWGDHWHVDGPANNGPGWTRTGTVPNITANPSIQTPRYHGWLRNGVLVKC